MARSPSGTRWNRRDRALAADVQRLERVELALAEVHLVVQPGEQVFPEAAADRMEIAFDEMEKNGAGFARELVESVGI